jgi:hypothetical protein
METTVGVPNVLPKILLSCGILASLLSIGADLLAGERLKDYNFFAQSMSELSAAGSPTRTLVVLLSIAASAFLIAFAAGVWQAAGPSVLPRIVAGLIFGNAAAGLTSTLFFPNQFGVRSEFSTPGVMLMIIGVLCFVLAMVVGAAAFPGWMRILSIAIPAAYIILAILRFATVSSSAAGPTGLIGAQERTMVYSFQAWVMALAIYLLIMSNRTMDIVSAFGTG